MTRVRLARLHFFQSSDFYSEKSSGRFCWYLSSRLTQPSTTSIKHLLNVINQYLRLRREEIDVKDKVFYDVVSTVKTFGLWNVFWRVAGTQTGSFLQSSRCDDILNCLSGNSWWNSHFSFPLSMSGQLLRWKGWNVNRSSDTQCLLHSPFELHFTIQLGNQKSTIFFYAAICNENSDEMSSWRINIISLSICTTLKCGSSTASTSRSNPCISANQTTQDMNNGYELCVLLVPNAYFCGMPFFWSFSLNIFYLSRPDFSQEKSAKKSIFSAVRDPSIVKQVPFFGSYF